MSNKMNNNSLPDDFLKRLDLIFGQAQAGRMMDTFTEKPCTFRVNTIKAGKDEILEVLQREGFKVKRVSWYGDALVLQSKTKRELTEQQIYIDGKIYLQSLASMVPPLVLDPQPGKKVLDLTAAPGSKTSQIAALMKKDGELVANDNNKIRFFKLKHNMEILGVIGGEPVNGWNFSLHMEHGAGLCRKYPEYFDKILLDAPCSAEARFIAGDSRTYGYWKERKIKEMAFKQRQLLFAAWSALKPGGIMVYSTCTFAPEENEMQISKLADVFKDKIEILNIDLPGLERLPAVLEWKSKKLNPLVKKCFRVQPTKEIEGFFIAKIKKI